MDMKSFSAEKLSLSFFTKNVVLFRDDVDEIMTGGCRAKI